MRCWAYDTGSQAATCHGTVCDKVLSGSVLKLDFVHGCAAPTIL